MVVPMKSVIASLASDIKHVSKRLIASYILDWFVILVVSLLGGAFNWIEAVGTRHAFNLSDPSISYPYRPDTVSVRVLAAVTVLGPAAITAAISILIPHPTAPSTSRSIVLRRKLWEWNAAWLGLGLALSSTFMITEGLKDIAGNPRPHLLALCDPDLSAESIRRWRVGGLGPDDLTTSIPTMVTWRICRTADSGALHNAFASWPSGHSSFSWAGMLYLTLFLCAKFGVHLPLLLPTGSPKSISTFDEEPEPRSPEEKPSYGTRYREPREEAAAPPLYILLFISVPIGAATYIAVSRWFDYRHHGIDIFTGSLIGATSAYLSFRFYHLPIRGGAGWAWGARTRKRAFWLGIGVPTYVGEEGWMGAARSSKRRTDLENATRDAGVSRRTNPESAQQQFNGA